MAETKMETAPPDELAPANLDVGDANGDGMAPQPDMIDLVEVDEAYVEHEVSEGSVGKDGSPELIDCDKNETTTDAAAAGEQQAKEESQIEEEKEDEEEEDEEDEDDDDDVKITIGDVKTNINFPSGGMGVRGPGGSKYVAGKLEIDDVAVINGTPVFEVDISNLEEHPWREPGADLTDYFNYGFTEDTWNIYCERQRRLRAEYGPENANRYYFNSIQSHYAGGNFDRNKPFMTSNIPTVGSMMPPGYPGMRSMMPSGVLPPNFAHIPAAPVETAAEGSGGQPPSIEPATSIAASASSAEPSEAEASATESVTTVASSVVAGRGAPPVVPLAFHGFPHGALPPVPGMPMTAIPPPGMLHPFGGPPPGLGFPPSFQYPPPHRAMFPPRGYAGFRSEREERPKSTESYSDRSSDGDRHSFDRYAKRGEYNSYRRSRSRGDSHGYSRHSRSHRSKRKHSRTPERSRHRSRDEHSSRSGRARKSSRDRQSGGQSGEKKSTEKKESSRVKEKSTSAKEEDVDSDKDIAKKEITPDDEPQLDREVKKPKERESKSRRRESEHKDRETKDRKRSSKMAEGEEQKSSKKKKKHKESRH